MKARFLLLPVLVLASLSHLCAAEPTVLSFPNYGFEIKGLPGNVDADPVQTVALFMPAFDGFTPNVNVQIQPYSGTLDDYAALSKSQFDEAKMNLLPAGPAIPGELHYEYTGTLNNKNFHWYSRALLANGKVYLATATTTAADWPTNGAALKACVDSLKLK